MTRSVKCLTHKVVKLFKGAIYVDAFFPNVLTLFFNYLHEISFTPKMLSYRVIVRAPISLKEFFRDFKSERKRKGRGREIDEF